MDNMHLDKTQGLRTTVASYKLSPPRTTFKAVERQRLTQALAEQSNARVCTVSAPAGFGKTSFLRSIYFDKQSLGELTAWLTLEEADNDPQRLLVFLAAAINYATLKTTTDEAARPWATMTDGASVELVLDQFSEIQDQNQRLSIFLDDFEVIHQPQVLKLVQELIQALPEGCVLYIGCRQSPKLSLTRLKSQGLVTKIGANDLRFSVDEAIALIANIAGMTLEKELATELQSRAGGWVTAIQLAAMSLERRLDTKKFIHNFSGSYIELGDYLTEEIIAKQPEEIRNFLRKTSILDALNPELCDAVCGRDNSAKLLQEIFERNLFLYPSNPEHSWFRYHKLFAQFLHNDLQKNHKNLLPELHRRAAQWHTEHGARTSAVEHALRSGDHPYANELITRWAPEFVLAGRLTTVNQWVEALPKKYLDTNLHLKVRYAAALTGTFQHRKVTLLIEELSKDNVLKQLDPESRGIVLFTVPYQLLYRDRFNKALAACDVNLLRVNSDDNVSRGAIMNVRSLCLLHLHRYEEVAVTTEEIKILTTGKTIFGQAYAECLSGMCELAQGRMNSARAIFQKVLDLTLHGTSKASAPAAGASCCLIETLYEANALGKARQLLDRYGATIISLGLPDIVITAKILESRMAYQEAGLGEAMDVLAEMKHLGYERDLPRMVANAWAEQSRLAVMHEDIDAASRYLQMAENNGPFETLSDESSTTLNARIRLANGQPEDATSLLQPEISAALKQNRQRYALKLKILLALAVHDPRANKPSMNLLNECLQLASREGFRRSFLNEGKWVQKLLQEFSATQPVSDYSTFVEELLAEFPAAPNAPETNDRHYEKLTRREFQILQLIEKGFTNQKIADEVFLSLPTIKTHVRNILGKLHALNRSEAVANARSHNLLN